MSIFPRYRIILATCLLSLCASLAQAGFVKVDDFDSYSPGDIVGQSNSPWSGTSAMGNVAADPTDVSNQVLAIETDSGVLRRPMTIPSNEAHMMFFRFRIESQPKYSFGMAPSATPSEFSDFGPEISVANNTGTGTNDLRVHDGTYVDVLTINQNTWYNAWVMVDNITDEFQMWVNDTPGGNADITTDRLYHDSDGDFDFRMAAVDALRSFYIKTAGGNSEDGPFYLDDIYLDLDNKALNLTNPVPEPSALILMGLGGLLAFVLMRSKAN